MVLVRGRVRVRVRVRGRVGVRVRVRGVRGRVEKNGGWGEYVGVTVALVLEVLLFEVRAGLRLVLWLIRVRTRVGLRLGFGLRVGVVLGSLKIKRWLLAAILPGCAGARVAGSVKTSTWMRHRHSRLLSSNLNRKPGARELRTS